MVSGVVSEGGKSAALNVKFANGGCEQFTVKPRSGRKVCSGLKFVIVQNGLESFENEFNLPAHTVKLQNLSGCDFLRQICDNYDELVVNGLQFRDFSPVFPGIGGFNSFRSLFNRFLRLALGANADRKIFLSSFILDSEKFADKKGITIL